MRLLVAEDNPRLLKTLVRLLENEGYAVDGVADGASALDYIRSCDYDGYVLDILMPGKDGLEVLRTARREGSTCPAMFLTALSDVSKRVEGLEAGADDYLPKPFAAAEFIARVHAMLRRRDSFVPPSLELCGASLDRAAHKLRFDGSEVALGNKEFQILEMLMGQPGTIISIDTIMEHAWSWDSKSDSSVVWVQVSNLRKKMAKVNAPFSIRFERGAGYVFEEQS